MTARPGPHPVARLLNDEQRARVRAATFVRVGARIAAEPNPLGLCVCPLGVAVDIRDAGQPTPNRICDKLGITYVNGSYPDANFENRMAVRDFIDKADNGKIDPADVYALLGCADEGDG